MHSAFCVRALRPLRSALQLAALQLQLAPAVSCVQLCRHAFRTVGCFRGCWLLASSGFGFWFRSGVCFFLFCLFPLNSSGKLRQSSAVCPPPDARLVLRSASSCTDVGLRLPLSGATRCATFPLAPPFTSPAAAAAAVHMRKGSLHTSPAAVVAPAAPGKKMTMPCSCPAAGVAAVHVWTG
jgi:hypothetical protein